MSVLIFFLASMVFSASGYTLLDKKTNKWVQKMFIEQMLYIDSNQTKIKLKLCGIDSSFFDIRTKIELLNKEIEKNNNQLFEINSEEKKFEDLLDNYEQIDTKLKYYEIEYNKIKISLSKEKRLFKVNFDREAYKFIFNDVNEMGDLLDCLEIKFIYKLPLIGKLEN